MTSGTQPEAARLLCTLNAHLDAVSSLEVVDSSTLASFSTDGCIKLWSIKSVPDLPFISQHTTHRHHDSPILCSATGQGHVFAGDARGSISALQLSQTAYEHIRHFRAGPEPVWSMSFNSYQQTLASSSPGKLQLWRVNQVSPRSEHCALSTNNRVLGGCAWSALCDLVVYSYDTSRTANEFICVDMNKNQEKGRFAQLGNFCNKFLFAAEQLMFCANESSTVSLYDMRAQCVAQEFVAHTQSVTAIELDEARGILMTGSTDSSLRLWDLRSLRCMQEFSLNKPKYDDSIFDIKYVKDSGLIVTGGADATIRFFQTP